MNIINTVKVYFDAGTDIETAISEAIDFAINYKATVTFCFNAVPVTVDQFSDITNSKSRYYFDRTREKFHERN